jgi:glucose/arabinose dehydrogenase
VGDGSTHGEGIEQPVYVLERSSAPSGLIFYAGDAFPRWRESLLAGSMGRRHLKRLVLEEGRVLHEERLMNGLGFRVREVAQGPDGLIYVTVDEGMLIRVRPAG